MVSGTTNGFRMTSPIISQLSASTDLPRMPGGNKDDPSQDHARTSPDFFAVFFAAHGNGGLAPAPEREPGFDLSQTRDKAGGDSVDGGPGPDEGQADAVSLKVAAIEEGLTDRTVQDARRPVGDPPIRPMFRTEEQPAAQAAQERPQASTREPDRPPVTGDFPARTTSNPAPAFPSRDTNQRLVETLASFGDPGSSRQSAVSALPTDSMRQTGLPGLPLNGLLDKENPNQAVAKTVASPVISAPSETMAGADTRVLDQARQRLHDLPLAENMSASGGSKADAAWADGLFPAPARTHMDRDRAKWVPAPATGTERDEGRRSGSVSDPWPGMSVRSPTGKPAISTFPSARSDSLLVQGPNRLATEGDSPLPREDASSGLTVSQALQAGAPVGTSTAVAGQREFAGRVAHQMGSAIAANPEADTVDIRLNPRELGSVQMTLKAQDGGLTLAILADRPETLDLMRRHIDQLSTEFRAMGYSDIAFSFGNRDNGTASSDREMPDQSPTLSQGADIEPGEADARPRKIANGALDIRL